MMDELRLPNLQRPSIGRRAAVSTTSRGLAVDAAAEVDRIVSWLRTAVRQLGRRGVVLGTSGGIDSSVCLALCVRAWGPDRVVALVLPERDSDPSSQRLAIALASHLGVKPVIEDLTPALTGLGCYRRRDAAIGIVFPHYDPEAGHRARITLPPDLLSTGTLSIYSLTIVMPNGQEQSVRLSPDLLAQIVAATSLKQRTRATMMYHHAELRRFAVVGAINRTEQDLGFLVKHADNGVDLEPIAHLYKTQVYQLGHHLGLPSDILDRTPTSDTYSAPLSQQAFFFRMPFEVVDSLLAACQGGLSIEEVGAEFGLTPEAVRRGAADISRKRLAARYVQTTALRLTAGVASDPIGPH